MNKEIKKDSLKKERKALELAIDHKIGDNGVEKRPLLELLKEYYSKFEDTNKRLDDFLLEGAKGSVWKLLKYKADAISSKCIDYVYSLYPEIDKRSTEELDEGLPLDELYSDVEAALEEPRAKRHKPDLKLENPEAEGLEPKQHSNKG